MATSPSLAFGEMKHWWLSNHCREVCKRCKSSDASQDESEVSSALNLLDASLSLSPRFEPALELKARTLLYLRRFKQVANMLQEYIPSFKISSEESNLSLEINNSSRERVKLLFENSSISDSTDQNLSFKCFSVSDLRKKVMAGLCKHSEKEGQWRKQQYNSQVVVVDGYGSNGVVAQFEEDSTNKTIFVGGLDPTITDDELRQTFSQYGDVLTVKIPLGKGCGFVQFANRNSAEEALSRLNGTVIGKQTVRLSWGRSPANKQRADPGNQWNGGYYGGQGYDGYAGYPAAAAPQNPNAYAAAAYGAYPVYGNANQQQIS